MILTLKQKLFLVAAATVFLAFFITLCIFQIKSCQKDQEINALQKQLLEQTNYAVKQVDKNTQAVSTLKVNGISKEDVSGEVNKQLKKYNLDAVYAANTEAVVEIKKSIKGASKPTETIVNNTTTTVLDQPTKDKCNSCLSNLQIRVPFEGQEGPIAVSGYTLTGPALGEPGSYELNIDVIKDVEFEIVLAQDKKGHWTTFVNSEDPDFKVLRLKSKINVKAFKTPWYHKFLFPVMLNLTNKWDVDLTLGIYYQFVDHVSFGLQGGILFLNQKEMEYRWRYGVGIIIHS